VEPKPSKSAGKQTRKRVLTDLRRGEIIAAALKVFAKKGFHNTRAEDVAVQAKIAKGTLYLYFDSKEAIYEAAVTHGIAQLQAMVAERLQGAETVAEQLRVFVSTRLEFWSHEGELYRMVLTVGREKKQRKQTAASLLVSVELLMEILRGGIKRGELAKRPMEPIAWAVMDMLRGALERRIDGATALSCEAETALITEIALRYFEAV